MSSIGALLILELTISSPARQCLGALTWRAGGTAGWSAPHGIQEGAGPDHGWRGRPPMTFEAASGVHGGCIHAALKAQRTARKAQPTARKMQPSTMKAQRNDNEHAANHKKSVAKQHPGGVLWVGQGSQRPHWCGIGSRGQTRESEGLRPHPGTCAARLATIEGRTGRNVAGGACRSRMIQSEHLLNVATHCARIRRMMRLCCASISFGQQFSAGKMNDLKFIELCG